MYDKMDMIARIKSPFPQKFGIPRQSGIANVQSAVIFEPKFRDVNAVRGLDGFSHIWLIWQFSECAGKGWSPTVRPPKLGGNKHMGVFATRSPFRPNPIGLSSVRLERIDIQCENAPVLYISGADIMDGTPVYDIKPYLPFSDCHTDAKGGFAEDAKTEPLEVVIPERLLMKIPENMRRGLYDILKADPRPGYHNDPERRYTLSFGDNEISFLVDGKTLTVTDVYMR